MRHWITHLKKPPNETFAWGKVDIASLERITMRWSKIRVILSLKLMSEINFTIKTGQLTHESLISPTISRIFFFCNSHWWRTFHFFYFLFTNWIIIKIPARYLHESVLFYFIANNSLPSATLTVTSRQRRFLLHVHSFMEHIAKTEK